MQKQWGTLFLTRFVSRRCLTPASSTLGPAVNENGSSCWEVDHCFVCQVDEETERVVGVICRYTVIPPHEGDSGGVMTAQPVRLVYFRSLVFSTAMLSSEGPGGILEDLHLRSHT